MSTPQNLHCLEVNPSDQAEASLIWLHGLGATADDFVPLASDLQLLSGYSLRFVFPQAPEIAVTVNNGMVMPAWYDIQALSLEGRVDQAGIERSVTQVQALIAAEKERGFASDRIFVAGFSQGAVVALSTMLKSAEPLAGAIALSGYLPSVEISRAKHKTPIFMGHGLQDEVVPYLLGQMAYEALEKANYPVTACAYPMAHQVCGEEVEDLAAWLGEVFEV